MDFSPPVVGIDDVGAGRPRVRAYGEYRNGIRITRARRLRFLHRSGVGTHYLEHDVPALFLLIPFVEQLVLARIQLQEKMLIAVLVDIRFLNHSSNAYAGSNLLQSFRAVYVSPQRSIATSGRGL